MRNSFDWKKHKKTLGKDLTDNVKVNVLLSPVYFAIVVFFLHTEHGLPFLEPLFSSACFFGFLSTLIYVYSSHYYQPDLDIHVNRPGMGHFPLGRVTGAFKYGRFLKWLFYPVNRFWYYLWHPYGRLFTHRGIGHLPVIGVLLRTGYLFLWVLFFDFFLKNTPYGFVLDPIRRWLLAFVPGTADFGSLYFFLWCFPVYLSDFFHIAVDYYDSVRKGISFCPPKIPRGMIAQVWEAIFGSK